MGLQLDDLDAVDRPAVRGGDVAQIALGLAECHVEAALTPGHALPQELKRQGGLSRTRRALHEIQVAGR
jgi:hypothetical protein